LLAEIAAGHRERWGWAMVFTGISDRIIGAWRAWRRGCFSDTLRDCSGVLDELLGAGAGDA
jgi:hypothetical protein